MTDQMNALQLELEISFDRFHRHSIRFKPSALNVFWPVTIFIWEECFCAKQSYRSTVVHDDFDRAVLKTIQSPQYHPDDFCNISS